MWTGVLFMVKVILVLFLGLIGLVVLLPLVGLIAVILGALFGKWEE